MIIKKRKLKVTDFFITENYPKLVITFNTDKSANKLFGDFFDALSIDYVSSGNIPEGFETGIHFYYKKEKYDLETVRFYPKVMIMIVRSNSDEFQKQFLKGLVKYSEYIGNKKELIKLWKNSK